MDNANAASLAVETSDTAFDADVMKAAGYVLVDMWADWCTPCHMLAPHLEKVASRLQGKLKLVKLNTDENQRTAIQYQVMSLPTLMLFKDGQVVGQSVGFRPEPALMKWLEERGMDISPAA